MSAEFAQSGGKRSALPGAPLPFFLDAGEGERAHIFDSLVTVLLSGDETGGQFGVFTLGAPKGEAIPTHAHADVHEIFFLLHGRARVWIQDGEGELLERALGPGDFGYVPAGLLHTFRVEAGDTRILGVCSGGFERFFAAAGTRTGSFALPEPPYVPSAGRLAAAGREFGNDFHVDVRLDG